MPLSPTVTTFYSYKGGTGRTMALANIAVLFGRRGEGDVLAVDWDLEAPGLHRFFEPYLSDALRKHDGDIRAPPGLIEMFIEVQARVTPSGRRLGEVATAELWREIDPEQYILQTNQSRVYILKAGRLDEMYAAKVNTFDWQTLYDTAPSLFRTFAAHLGRRFRYVLIDSRTGVTDSSGICTMLLPDRLVVVFTPNRQSVEGVIDLIERATRYRKNSDDVRPLVVYPLASRVEVSEPNLKDLWRLGEERASVSVSGTRHDRAPLVGYEHMFEELFRKVYDLPECRLTEYFDEVQIQHASHLAYGEEIAVAERSQTDRLSIANSFVRFFDALLDPQGPWGFKPEARPVEDTTRAEAALLRVDNALAWHRHQAVRLRLRERMIRLAQALAVVGAVICGVAQYLSGQVYLLWAAVGALIFAAALEGARLLLAPDRDRVIHETAARELERERYLFETHAGDYAEARAPTRLLAERVAQILDEAEEARIERRGIASRRA